MGGLSESLQRASLQGREDVEATLTDIDYDADDDQIVVSYNIGTGSGEPISDQDTFETPEADATEYDFVELCRQANVSLSEAPDDLPGTVLPVESTDSSWELQIESVEGTSIGALELGNQFEPWIGPGTQGAHWFLLLFVLGYPLFIPFLVLHFRVKEGSKIQSLNDVVYVLVFCFGLFTWCMYAGMGIAPFVRYLL